MTAHAPVNGDPKATGIGFVSIAIWGFAALTVHLTRGLPPFEVLTIGFGLGGVLLTLWGYRQQRNLNFLRQPWHYYAIIVMLIFINNAGFILGLRLAPIVTASLINYLWPILIVLLSVPMLGRPLRWWHFLGAVMGFGGCVWLMTDGSLAGLAAMLSAQHWLGYVFAFVAALSWAVYSLVLRRSYEHVPTQTLGGVFVGVAALCALTLPVGLTFEGSFNTAWRWPAGAEIIAVLTIGIGTLGLAYACWDYGAKKGDVRVMGVVSYLTPLLSTMMLALIGDIEVSGTAWLACLMIIGGAFVGSAREIFGGRQLGLKTD